MSDYTDTLNALATSTETAVVALYERFLAGDITEAEFVELGTVALEVANARGAALADLALATQLSVQRKEPVPTVGLSSTRTKTVARQAILDALTEDGDATEAVRVAVRAETLAGAQDAYHEGMQEQGVKAWTRVLNSGACKLCQDLAGDVLPGHAEMYHHKGCGCSQKPVGEEPNGNSTRSGRSRNNRGRNTRGRDAAGPRNVVTVAI
ncbi:MAG: hypothetical protein GX610_22705 [Rhodococcus sp.]|nr:hypothetical protein [Rhodococcus sp. (in: high G+C Gram-positive bacteria)]